MYVKVFVGRFKYGVVQFLNDDPPEGESAWSPGASTPPPYRVLLGRLSPSQVEEAWGLVGDNPYRPAGGPSRYWCVLKR